MSDMQKKEVCLELLARFKNRQGLCQYMTLRVRSWEEELKGSNPPYHALWVLMNHYWKEVNGR